jgi:hypothetical protein
MNMWKSERIGGVLKKKVARNSLRIPKSDYAMSIHRIGKKRQFE